MARAMSVCSTPRCPTLTYGGRCDDCKARARAGRRSASRSGYDARWRAVQRAYLRAHPYCAGDAHSGDSELLRPNATQVDHIDGLGPLGPRGYDWDNLQSLCHSCHSKKTARDHGFGAR